MESSFYGLQLEFDLPEVDSLDIRDKSSARMIFELLIKLLMDEREALCLETRFLSPYTSFPPF